MPKDNYKDKDYSGGKKYPFVQEPASPNFNLEWLGSGRALEMATESVLKDDPKLGEEKAREQAQKNLDARKEAIKSAKVSVEPLKDAKAMAWESFPGIRENPEISLNPNYLEGGTESLLIHERDHTLMDMPESDRELLERNEQQNSNVIDWKYRISSPEEMRARSQVFRNVLKREGIADPFREMITPDHIRTMKEKYGVGKPKVETGDNELDNIQQFLRNTSEDSAAEILNTVAQLNTAPAPKAWGLA